MRTLITTLTLALGFAALPACTSNNTSEMSADAAKAEALESAELSQGYVKPGASVRFRHTYDGQTQPGELETFKVYVTGGQDARNLQVKVRGAEGMQVKSSRMEKTLEAKDQNEQVMDVSVNSTSQGKHYVYFDATTQGADGQVLGRAYAIGIQIGDPALNQKPETNLKFEETQSGEKIAIMEAQETIE